MQAERQHPYLNWSQLLPALTYFQGDVVFIVSRPHSHSALPSITRFFVSLCTWGARNLELLDVQIRPDGLPLFLILTSAHDQMDTNPTLEQLWARLHPVAHGQLSEYKQL